MQNPVFFRELAALARRERIFYERVGLALVLLVQVWAIFPRVDYFEPNTQNHVTQDFFHAQFALIAIVMTLMTPGYVIGCFSEERERGTLDLLLTTHLTPSEIVWGKALGRLLHLWAFMLLGLPILSFCQFGGGIDPNQLFICFGSLALWTFALTGAAVYADLSEGSYWTAWIFIGSSLGGYLLLAMLFSPAIILTPFHLLYWLHDPTQKTLQLSIAVGLSLLCYAVLGTVLLLLATRILLHRRSSKEILPLVPKVPSQQLRSSDLLPVILAESYGSVNQPLGRAWVKSLEPQTFRGLNLPPTVVIALAFALIVLISGVEQEIIIGYGVFFGSLYLVLIYGNIQGIQAATLIPRERQANRLPILFTLPVTRDELIESEFWAFDQRTVPVIAIFLGLYVIFGLQVMTRSSTTELMFFWMLIMGFFGVVLPMCVYTQFFWGLWCSIYSTTTPRAVWLYLVGFFTAPILAVAFTFALSCGGVFPIALMVIIFLALLITETSLKLSVVERFRQLID